MHVFGEPLKSESMVWESKNMFHFSTPTKQNQILCDINPPLLTTYNSLMDYREIT